MQLNTKMYVAPQGRNTQKIEILIEEDKKKLKLDCAGLVIETARVSGLLKDNYDLSNYSNIPDGSSLVSHLHNVCILKDKKDILPGDIVVMSWDNSPTHLAIFLGDFYGIGANYIIHSYIVSKKVSVHRLDSNWDSYITNVFSIKGIDERVEV